MYPSWRRPTSVTTPSPDRQSVACAQQGAVKSHEVKGAPAVRNPLANGNASAVIKLPQAAWAAGAALAPAGAVLDKRLRRPPPLPPRAVLGWASARLLAALAYRRRRRRRPPPGHSSAGGGVAGIGGRSASDGQISDATLPVSLWEGRSGGIIAVDTRPPPRLAPKTSGRATFLHLRRNLLCFFLFSLLLYPCAPPGGIGSHRRPHNEPLLSLCDTCASDHHTQLRLQPAMSLPGLRGTSRALRGIARPATLPVAGRRAKSSMAMDGQQQLLAAHLQKADPAVFDIIENEKKRQKHFINLIPSENFTSQAVLDALGSVMQNKYSEGYPGARYYGGNEFIDQAERLCQQRALEAFDLDPKNWGVNVQALSGAPANLYVYSALMNTHDRLMGLDLPHGGHLSHGYQTPTKKISFISKYFETLPYRLDESTGLIDYDKLEEMALLYRPKIIVAGASAYSRLIDYKRMREICDKVNAYMLADMAHISGLVAAKVMPGPFPYADIVTTTSHKSLRGPRGALIFFRKGVRRQNPKTKEDEMYNLEGPINTSVFPGHQGGPHNHTITALAVALKQAQSPDFHAYQSQVLANAKAFAKRLGDDKGKGGLGYSIVSGGTDNHLVLADLKPHGVDGGRVERVLELVGVAANKNTVPGDRSALVPGGLRMGTPAMTTRGFNEDDFVRVADVVDRAVAIAARVDKTVRAAAKDKGEKSPGKLKLFLDHLGNGDNEPEIVQLRSEVEDWVGTYPLPWESGK
ncbi:serine hydroxymethyltransferase [Purpureocillium lilacinum]|uniref:Serine hydroxymethyltransferase n=1 Tax=Purpureocillium lilacinum TaxID=33203 RepID=A0A2U3EN72_PURLI|nr:serine hydroxymethyltransferase [Purpureocillium lilacinum]